jgi:anti-anti-sigma regulatory factor
VHWEIIRSNEGHTLKLEGRCVVDHADELKTALIDALKSEGHLVIDLERVSEVDLSCLQLFCSAHKSSLLLSKHFSLANPPECYLRVAEDAGYHRVLSCHEAGDGGLMWTGEEG